MFSLLLNYLSLRHNNSQLSVSHNTNVPVYSETRITFGQRVRAAATHGRVKPRLLFYPN